MNNSASSLHRPTRYPLRRHTVPTTTLDEIFRSQQLETCDLMKIDVEGWEYETVLGAKDLFSSGRVRAIALEMHPEQMARRGLDATAVTGFLKTCGYEEEPNLGHLLLALHG